MFDEISQSVDVNTPAKPIGFERFLGRRVVVTRDYYPDKTKLGTIESLYLDDGHPNFIIGLDDGSFTKAWLGEIKTIKE